MSRYGRNHVPEPLSSVALLHHYDGFSALQTVDHSPDIPVLDQQDLLTQGIYCSRLIPGAKDVKALGSCVCNATTAALAACKDAYTLAQLGIGPSAVDDECFAIVLYHQVTSGNPAAEWPPTDHGTSGLAACAFLEQAGVISGHRIAHDAESILSLMQHSGLIVGQPFLNAWETPDVRGFIDGDGSPSALEDQIRSGVAGGHETYWEAIEHIAVGPLGYVDPFHTVIRFRNSWGTSWGDQGRAYAHLSTFIRLGRWCDFRALLP